MIKNRGRTHFDRHQWLLKGLATFLRLLPRSFCQFLWDLVWPFSGLIFVGLRYAVAARLLHDIGDVVFFGRAVTIRYWDKIQIGSNVSIQAGCYIDGYGGLKISNDVSIGHSTSIMTYDHGWDDPGRPIRENELSVEPVKIADDVWIGCGVRLLKGTVLGRRTIVGAGAVVNKAFPDGFVVLGGVPAKVIRKLEQPSGLPKP